LPIEDGQFVIVYLQQSKVLYSKAVLARQLKIALRPRCAATADAAPTATATPYDWPAHSNRYSC